MKLLYLLLILTLFLNPLGCASNKHTIQEESTNIEQQEKKVSAWGMAQFVGALCLFGLFSPSHTPTDTEYVTEIDGKDGTFNPQRKYRIDRKKDGETK